MTVDQEIEAIKYEAVEIVKAVRAEMLQVQKHHQRVTGDISSLKTEKETLEARISHHEEEAVAALNEATTALASAEAEVSTSRLEMQELRSAAENPQGHLADTKIKEIALVLGGEIYQAETRLRDVQHAILVLEKKAKAEELGRSLKHEALERKWSIAEVANESAASQLGAVQHEIEELHEQAVLDEAEARLSEEEISQRRQQTEARCTRLRSAVAQCQCRHHAVTEDQRTADIEGATLMQGTDEIEQKAGDLETQVSEGNKEIEVLQGLLEAKCVQNEQLQNEADKLRSEIESVSNRSLDFVSRIKMSRHTSAEA